MKDLWMFKGGGAAANSITLSGKSIVPPGTRCVIVDKDGKFVCSGTAVLGSVKISMDPQALMDMGASFTLKALDEGEEYVESAPVLVPEEILEIDDEGRVSPARPV